MRLTYNSTDNDDLSNWCTSLNQLTSGDYGTPKTLNTICN